MNWEQLEGSWKQLRGTVRQKWGKLTDNDVEYIAGKRDRLAGKLQERYGLAKEEAEKKADEWLGMLQEMEAGKGQHRSAKG
ncbi:MAG: CsbD family protein [Acidobacteriia bacterium]|nr:CsbD family protein [Terriglobia bacterium]